MLRAQNEVHKLVAIFSIHNFPTEILPRELLNQMNSSHDNLFDTSVVSRERTTVNTFDKCTRTQLRFRNTANACRPFIVHILSACVSEGRSQWIERRTRAWMHLTQHSFS